jgi:hypothetical protein
MAKDKKTAKKLAKRVSEILNESNLLKETQTQTQVKPEWDSVKTNAPNKMRPGKKRG